MKIILSDNMKDAGKKGVVYVPQMMFVNIITMLHEMGLLPKAAQSEQPEPEFKISIVPHYPCTCDVDPKCPVHGCAPQG